jgi:hypothetical protein
MYYAQHNGTDIFWTVHVEVLILIKFIISILQKVHDSQQYSPESWSMYFTYLKTIFWNECGNAPEV